MGFYNYSWASLILLFYLNEAEKLNVNNLFIDVSFLSQYNCMVKGSNWRCLMRRGLGRQYGGKPAPALDIFVQ
jgi:hypothetical protein